MRFFKVRIMSGIYGDVVQFTKIEKSFSLHRVHSIREIHRWVDKKWILADIERRMDCELDLLKKKYRVPENWTKKETPESMTIFREKLMQNDDIKQKTA